MDPHTKTVNLRDLWDSRNARGLLPVLEEMNALLDQGLITNEDFQSCFSELNEPPQMVAACDEDEEDCTGTGTGREVTLPAIFGCIRSYP